MQGENHVPNHRAAHKCLSCLALLRPTHWAKNGFVFLPLFFDGALGDKDALLRTSLVFASFCLLASAVYCLNDLRDIEADRRHPKKRTRPLASGAVSKGECVFLMVLLSLLAFVPLRFLSERREEIALVLILYGALNVAYCLWLKHLAVVDVLALSFGYVLRLLGGGIAGGITLTHWIVLMTFLLALFLALAKRRDDLLIMQKTGEPPRKNTARYSLDFINQSLTVTMAVTLFCYIMYTVSGDVMARFGTERLYVTALFVLAGFLRYLQLSLVDGKSGDPTRLLLRDRVLQLVLALWGASFAVIIYAGR